MLQELKFQLSTAILTIVTLAAGVGAVVNFNAYRKFHLPDDGVIWVGRAGAVQAISVRKGSPADNALIHSGDELLSINNVKIEKETDVARVLATINVWGKADYHLLRGGVEFDADGLIVGEVPKDRVVFYQYIVGVAYLVIGLFVYFRRGSAQRARHFYCLCLASFIFYCFHYTGQFNGFDKAVYFANIATSLLAPALFLHFCLIFPEPVAGFARPVRAAFLYLPGALLFAAYLAFASGTLRPSEGSLIEIRWWLDRLNGLLAFAPYGLGAIVLSIQCRRADDTLIRQQLKWLRNGTIFGFLPCALFYVLPYSGFGTLPGEYLKLMVLSMVLIPLTLAYAVVRYRLMDVEILFRRGYAYTLATVCVLAGFYGIIFTLATVINISFKDLPVSAVVCIMLVAAFLLQPVRAWVQERLDRHFYQDSYDYRRTLVEFARELGSETDLDTMLSAAGERLIETLNIKHVGFFLAEDSEGSSFEFKKATGNNPRLAAANPTDFDLQFLNWKRTEPYLFFERTRHHLDAVSRAWPPSVKSTIADLDFTYYLPCTVRGRTIAYMGVSRTVDGDYLSSVDVELLITLTGYMAIAIENASLYRSLQRKVEEYERLKEFSENIVESINVGILAADLDDRVESWNTQIEQLTGVPREAAVGRALSEIFPTDLCDQFNRVRGEFGIHHIYKYVLRPEPAGVNGSASVRPGRLRESTLNLAIAPLVSKDQQQIGRLIIFDDVTDRAELEQRLVQADKLSSIGLLAAGVAHEVNTPLAVISTYAQMLAKQVADDSQKSLILDKIAKQTFRASEIVNSLLNFSRTSSTSFGDIQLNKVIQETVSLLEHQLTKSGVQVKTDLADLRPIYGNGGKLQQVFLNLFLNARDAMPGGGTLEIRTWAEGPSAHAEVSDTGTGIAPDLLHRIYDPFFTTKTARKGTGLGLSVTYGIIQEHGGSIEVSNRPGGGACFRLDLPFSAPRKPVNELLSNSAAR
jgi:two-component system NtrC family sensor kinase